jgi:hypothetical protein
MQNPSKFGWRGHKVIVVTMVMSLYINEWQLPISAKFCGKMNSDTPGGSDESIDKARAIMTLGTGS